ncbi:MAG: hypothetical protein Q8O67_16430 [Deltaproteobacteria bacterium]|nr:hypothetical protein [Deltaproteobacteria bacterium]
MIAALLITAALAAPATLTDGRGHSPRPSLVEKSKRQQAIDAPVRLAQASLAADPNSPDQEPSFIDQYLSFQLSPVPAPAVKDGLVLSHVIGYLLWGICGGLWGPIVAIDGAEFSGDVVLTWFLSSILWYAIVGVVSFTGVGALLVFAIPYLQTTATMNAIDRQLKKKGVVGVTPGGKKPPPNPATTPGTPDTPPPSYAY